MVGAPDVEIAPLWYTIDPVSAGYTANIGTFTNASELAAHFAPLDDIARLSIAVAVTDIAGKTRLRSAPLP